MALTAKRSEYAVEVDRSGTASSDRGGTARRDDGWSPEHQVLEALARCSIASLAYHARRASLGLVASASASGAVAQREDGGWGFVEIACRIQAELDPAPSPDQIGELISRAERGCFVGASLEPRPTYSWLVNGTEVGTREPAAG